MPRHRGRASALPLLRARTAVDAAVDHVATYYEHKARSSTRSYGTTERGEGVWIAKCEGKCLEGHHSLVRVHIHVGER